jgi:uncharacterized protein YbjT (DUF2867 family)
VKEDRSMKIVVIGGTGLIGSKASKLLRARGHEVLAAAPNTGVNTLTGEGVAQAVAGAQVVVDVANSPSFEDEAVMEFFTTSGRNLLAAEVAAGVRHHVVLSVVGTDRLPASGYMRAKLAQERLVRESKLPYTILRSTQFFEFLPGIAKGGGEGNEVRLCPAAIQPIASDDVALAVADVASSAPVNGMVEVAGPERVPLAKIVQRYLAAIGDAHEVVIDVHARYFGTELDDTSLVPAEGARIGAIRFETWLSQQPKVS